MENKVIKIRGAKVHNLKNINVDIPKNKLVVITGISGSGKSSLAFDTLYAEGQRRYVESLSAYARQFLGVMDKPEVDKIEGISPAISIDQRKAAHNPRSTVGTITEIYDYLRLLFARIGKPHCPKCKKSVSRQTIDQIVEQILELPASTRCLRRGGPKRTEILILGPVVRGRKGEHRGLIEEIQRSGFIRIRVDGILHRIEGALELKLDRKKKHNIEVVVDRLIIDKDLDRSRLVDSLETALKLGKGVVIASLKHAPNRNRLSGAGSKVSPSPRLRRASKSQKSKDIIFSEHFACEECGISLPELEPRLFSFNSPYGACPACQGLGEKLEVAQSLVIPNPNLSIAEGAIRPWMRASHKLGRQSYFWWQLSELSEQYIFSLDVPIKELSQKNINLILYGEKPPIPNSKHLTSNIQHLISKYEGVIPYLQRRYQETDSEYTRKEIEQYMIKKKCEDCQGRRLKPEALAVTVAKKSINEIVKTSIGKIKKLFEKLLYPKPYTLNPNERGIAQPIVKEIIKRLQFLIDVGLDYLTLNRKAETLSAGEEQRIRLATQLGSQLTGVLYILDEPSIGLHLRDQERLIGALKKLRDLGNTVILCEHDPQTIFAADWVIDIGPGAGKHGGKIIFEGTPKQLLKAKTLTGDYLSGRKKVEIKATSDKRPASPARSAGASARRAGGQATENNHLIIKKAAEHNLKNIDVKIPLGKFVCITGVSGSGKSSLMNDILAKALMRKFYKAKEEPGRFKELIGTEFLDKVVLVDQSPIGRTPRSNPATYTGVFSYIRDLFSKTREARIRGYRPGRFSFNVKGGRCEVCQGQGQIKIEMYFLPDIYIECQECKGKRFNKETLNIEYKGKNIAEVLEMTVEEALNFFKNIPSIYHKLKTLYDVGLGYIQLGQPAPSLSGGEAQRVKLATELSKKATGKTLYILDEPTTGLHLDDIKKLIFVLKSLVDKGNTILVTEHNLSIIRNADWIIDLGPEGGDEGGQIIAEGAPPEIAENRKSYTGKYLRKVFAGKVL
ncbi:excinuclease ABC subunit UvrA [Patescibacteria group bacterium]|nr:excinuclease ABC subunit UvrA [Patescibacteria group bacterium]